MAVRINRDILTQEQKERIRKELYMQPKQSGFFKKKRFAQAKDPILMWALDKPNNEVIVPYIFGNILMGTHINSQRQYPGGKFNFTGTLRTYQEPIIREAMEHLSSYGTTTLAVYPGAGKTIMSARLASAVGGLTLVVYPIKMVEPSWINTFKQFTDASVWVNDGKAGLPSSCNVILTMDTQFHKIPQEVLRMVRVLVVDEAHKFCVPSRTHCLLGTTPQYVIACTATPIRDDGMESILHSVCGTHGIYLKSPKRFSVYCLKTGIKTEIILTKNGDPDWSRLVKDLCEDPLRNSFIVDLVERNYQHKIMIFTWNKAHAYFLKKVLSERGISVDVLAGNKNTYRDSRVLVATTGKAGCGFDEAMACPDWSGERSNMIILTGSTKSLTIVEQGSGRVFRSDFPTIIDMVDDNAICKRHWNERRKWYEDPERNGEIFYIEMKKNEGAQGNSEVGEDLGQKRIENIHGNMAARARAKLQIVNQ